MSLLEVLLILAQVLLFELSASAVLGVVAMLLVFSPRQHYLTPTQHGLRFHRHMLFWAGAQGTMVLVWLKYGLANHPIILFGMWVLKVASFTLAGFYSSRLRLWWLERSQTKIST